MEGQTEFFASSADSQGRGSARLNADGAEELNPSRFSDLRLDDDDNGGGHEIQEEKILEDARVEDGDSELRMFTDYGIWIDDGLRMAMEMEKRTYPGAGTWAADEERLFEILYLRQELPILPSFWEIDFRGFPISERCFGTAGSAKPIIYAHSWEFRATMALTRLIDLTANVRTLLQCGLPHKAPPMIRQALSSYISWAAQDGSYAHLEIVPNIIAEVVDPAQGEASITRTIENRMRALARLQREYLRVRRDVDFGARCPSDHGDGDQVLSWRTRALRLMNMFFRLFETQAKEALHESDTKMDDAPSHHGASALKPEEMLQELSQQHDAAQEDRHVGGTHEPSLDIIKEEEDEEGRDAPMADIPLAPPPPPHPSPAPHAHAEERDANCVYRRRPPVVYGLFVVNTSILIMSVDSARGKTGYVSFHVDIDLREHKQSVWNALTTAMVVCLARDEMMSRLDDFDEVAAVEEIDVDV